MLRKRLHMVDERFEVMQCAMTVCEQIQEARGKRFSCAILLVAGYPAIRTRLNKQDRARASTTSASTVLLHGQGGAMTQ
eukprot:245824-Alexandrium_andersonii.AAC.1